MTVLSITVIKLIGFAYPFWLPQDRRLEYMNEFIILVCLYHYYIFTDFCDDPLTRYNIGFSLIGTAYACIAVNLIVMLK